MLSITDTLDDWGIDNAVLIVDKDKINELPTPFLVHTQSNGRKLLNVINIKEFANPLSADYKNWNGIVLAAEKPVQWNNTENAEWLKKDKSAKTFLGFAIGILLLFSLASLYVSFSWQMAGLLVSSFAGLSISVLIIQQELGYSNTITEQLCFTVKNADCNAVIRSKQSKISGWFKWADAGIIYFSSLSLLLPVSLLTGQIKAVLPLLSLLSLLQKVKINYIVSFFVHIFRLHPSAENISIKFCQTKFRNTCQIYS